jgi:hypothetical protein
MRVPVVASRFQNELDRYIAWMRDKRELSPLTSRFANQRHHVEPLRLFVDYAGTTLEAINGLTGEVVTAQLFVAARGATSYTYAEAAWTQAWIFPRVSRHST